VRHTRYDGRGGREKVTVVLPRARNDWPRLRPHDGCKPYSSLAVSAPLEGLAARPCAVWVERTRHVVCCHLAVLRRAAVRSRPTDHAFHRLTPRFRVWPGSRAPSCSLSEVLFPLSATQPSRATTPGFAYPGQVAPHAYHASRRFAPSMASLVAVATRRALGVLPVRARPDSGCLRCTAQAAPGRWTYRLLA